jgi:hypothetical protein
MLSFGSVTTSWWALSFWNRLSVVKNMPHASSIRRASSSRSIWAIVCSSVTRGLPFTISTFVVVTSSNSFATPTPTRPLFSFRPLVHRIGETPSFQGSLYVVV